MAALLGRAFEAETWDSRKRTVGHNVGMGKLAALSGLVLLALGAARGSVQVGPASGGGYVVPTWQIVRPAGVSLEWGGRPVDLVLSPDGSRLFVKDDRGLVVIDAATWRIRQELKFPEGGGSMHGIAVSRDGRRVWLTTAQVHLWEARMEGTGAAVWTRSIRLPGPGGGASHPCGIALSPDERLAYVCLSRNNALGIVDLREGRLVREIPTGIAPFDVLLSADGNTAYVSNWGGRRPRPGERTASTSGTETPVDERGIASTGSVSILDLREARELRQIETGLHPSDLALHPDGRRLFVANANSDTMSVLDVQVGKALETLTVRPLPDLPFGSAPNALALSGDGNTLFVANGGNNAIAVVELSDSSPTPLTPLTSHTSSKTRGFIPAGWYPGALAVRGGRLYVANVKGIGSRTRREERKGWRVSWYGGSVTSVEIPWERVLAGYTRQVRRDGRVPEILRAWERSGTGKKPVPVPERTGEPSVFEHVVYVIKENRTYDQVFGDLPRGNNDPALCVFGREVTPNHHALAEQFVLLDNFYCNGVLSADGHSWVTEGNVTDHLEKSFGGFTRSYTFGDDPLTYSSSGFLWDNVLAHGLSFRNYGEMDYAEPVPKESSFRAIYEDFLRKTGRIRFTRKIGIERLRAYSCPGYPGWNLAIPDVLRVDQFLKELAESERQGSWPSLVMVYLPNDHTSGTSPGAPTPRAQVADNDVALGRLVEGISRSRFWPKTCIFVVEDDPQDGFDHVDGHRSVALVVSPYTRRGAVVSEFYNQTGVLHTMERILGLPPMNQMDGMAPLMQECFTSRADLRPYTCLPNRIPLDEMNPRAARLSGPALHWARLSARQHFDRIDGVDEDTLNRILWHSVRGPSSPYPSHFAGGHGRGLKGLRAED